MELILEGIEKRFGEKAVLKGASYTFEEGKIYGLLGRNGAGKTTLFNCLSGDLGIDAGTMRLMDGGQDVYDPERIGLSFAEPVLPGFLTGEEYLRFYLDVNADRIENPLSIPEYFDLIRMAPEDRGRLIKNYSQGMKNKMQIVSFLISRPPVLLLDEPLTSFDVVVAHEMKEMLKGMKEGRIIIFSTHILQIASDICDEIVMLRGGTLSGLDRSQMDREDFEEEVIRLLREDEPGANLTRPEPQVVYAGAGEAQAGVPAPVAAPEGMPAAAAQETVSTAAQTQGDAIPAAPED
ncbi:MAG: ABC transporter ATP-binding protein [Lachnospiraceae bacterium]|nr:ABC transporter ATP-binding protein [Lachnospiraceae bacterium]